MESNEATTMTMPSHDLTLTGEDDATAAASDKKSKAGFSSSLTTTAATLAAASAEGGAARVNEEDETPVVAMSEKHHMIEDDAVECGISNGLHHQQQHEQQQQQQQYQHQPTEENTTEDDDYDYSYGENVGQNQQQHQLLQPKYHQQQFQVPGGESSTAEEAAATQYLEPGNNYDGKRNYNYDGNGNNDEEEDEVTPTSSSYCSSTSSVRGRQRQQQQQQHHQQQFHYQQQQPDEGAILQDDDNYNHDGIIPNHNHHYDDDEKEGLEDALSQMQLLDDTHATDTTIPIVREDALVLSNHNNLHPLGLDEGGMNESNMALTVLPPNELSTTSAEAAMAASTFADMLGGGGVMGGHHGPGGFNGEGGEERGIWIDEHGVHHPMMGMGVGGVGVGTGMTEDDGEDLLRGIGGNGGSSTGLYEYGLHDHHPGNRMRREGPPGLVVDDSGVVRRASSIGVSPMSSSRGGGGGGEPGGDYGSAGMRMGSGGGASSSSGRQGLYHGSHNYQRHHLHDSTHEGGGSGSGGRGGGIGVGEDDMGNCGGMRVCGGIDPLASPRMDPIGVGVDDTASEDDDDEEDVEEDEEEEDSSEISASDEDGSWIEWFCGLRGNEFFCEVDEDYIQDDFNLTGLYGLVPCYERALDMVLDVEMPMEDTLTEEQHEIVESAAEMLYGMIHARYIVTSRGMNAMYEKYRSATFGRCPHVYCQGQPVLPVGLSDMPRNYTVNVFCPRCHGLFFPKSTRQANIDGAYFGTTFPHLYLMTHPEIIPARPSQQYVPRVYGFRINQSSLYYRFHEGEEEDNSNENRALTRSSRSRQR